ncbi:hypothetical protein ACMFMG_005367 [Clarireedia jacksonii]
MSGGLGEKEIVRENAECGLKRARGEREGGRRSSSSRLLCLLSLPWLVAYGMSVVERKEITSLLDSKACRVGYGYTSFRGKFGSGYRARDVVPSKAGKASRDT